MKKSIFVLVVAIFSLTSCKKDRVCSCSYQDGTVVSENTYKNVTRKEAKTYCVSANQSVSCSIK
ncbi:MAG: hypothetical protein IPL10_08505 [Bacteroidetes bacterium]|nr:hypothetical protein [Bacteroidota bacterium]